MFFRPRRFLLFLFPSILLAFLAGMFFPDMPWSVPLRLPSSSLRQSPVALHSHGLQSKSFFENAYARVPRAEGYIPLNDARSVISPHHLLVAPDIARLFSGIAQEEIETVILISPNHFERGKGAAQVAFGTWETPYGELESDVRQARSLLRRFAFVTQEEETFEGEHGISALTPFVKHSFPNARILAFAVHDSLSAEDAGLLGQAFFDIPKSILIVSADMSHELPQRTQEYHDVITSAALERGVLVQTLETDTNAALRILFSFNERQGSQEWIPLSHTSSLELGVTKQGTENTSHFTGFFRAGPPRESPFASLHIVGDVMLDRGVRKRINETEDSAYPWRKVTRFLQGSALRIANLEGTINEEESRYTYNPPFRFVFSPSFIEVMKPHIDAVSLANNHAADVGAGAGQEETHRWLEEISIPWFGAWETPVPRFDREVGGVPITLIGYHAFQPNLETLEREIRRAKEDGRFVIVMPHWGVEYVYDPSSEQRGLARRMADAGADLVIGGHPHVVQGMEVVEGMPVLYSLGNFIFDQSMPITWRGLTVGLLVTDETITLHLLPVSSKDGQPAPLEAPEAQVVLDLIAEHSPESLREEIQKGVLIFPRN